MTSTDREIYVVIDGVQYKVEGTALREQPPQFEQAVMSRLDNIEMRLTKVEERTDILLWVVGAGIAFLTLVMTIIPALTSHREGKGNAPCIIQFPPYTYIPHKEEKSA